MDSTPDEKSLFLRFGVALFIGILIGMQREYASGKGKDEIIAGVRTFALFALIGSTAAFISDLLDTPWLLIVVLGCIGLLAAVAFYAEYNKDRIGLTTEVAILLTLLIGVLAYLNHLTIAVALGVIVTVLLSLKLEMHRFAYQITREDVYATLKFAVITAIILPVLPNQTYGIPPFDVLNPFKIWMLVILISGISFVGYILIKIIGPKKGITLTGALGGLASSTAVTLSFTQKSKVSPNLSKSFAVAIILSWTIMFVRIIIEVAAVNAALLDVLWLPVGVLIVVAVAYSIFLLFFQRQPKTEEEVTFENPFELGPAIKFGLIFMVILLFSKTAQINLGTTGIYLSSFVSGVADVDAITLSISQLSLDAEALQAQAAVRAIILAAISNTLVKGGMVVILGDKMLRKVIWPGFLMLVVAGVISVFLA